MNAEDLLSSKILSNKDILIDLYSVVRQAAIDATTSPEVITQSNNVCLLPLNEERVTRITYSKHCIDSRDANVTYLPDALTVIGGAALNYYDFDLQEFKARRDIPELKDFIKKSTSDLDMVWWPQYIIKNPELNNMCAISQSIAIETLAKIFTLKLQERFDEQKQKNTKMMSGIKDILEDPQTYVSASVRPVFPAGVWTVSCSFIANRTSYKIIDIAIHDTASSQKLNKYGALMNKLEPMGNDPVYTTLQPNTSKTITQLDFETNKVSVCNISEFINQQLFAFSLLVKEVGTRGLKSLINYKRIVYIIELLNNIQSNNSRNITILRKVFDIPSYEDRTEFINKIISNVTNIISLSNNYVIDICQSIEQRDNIINELYLIALHNKLKNLNIAYNTKLLDIQSPLRKAKRSRKQLSPNMKRNIDQSTAKLDAAYHKELADINKEISLISPLASKLLIAKVNTVSDRNDSINSIVSIAPNKTKQLINSIPPYIPMKPTAPPINNNYLRSIGYQIPTISTSSVLQNNTRKQHRINVISPQLTPPTIYSPPPKSKENQTLLESYKRYSAPHAPPSAPIESSQPLSIEQLIKSSRLVYNPITNKYTVFDVLHNIVVPIEYDFKIKLYMSYDSGDRVWLPLYYNITTGKYYPVYYYNQIRTYGYYNDAIGKIIPLNYYPDTYSYDIKGKGILLKDIPQLRDSYRRGGLQTRKNKSKK